MDHTKKDCKNVLRDGRRYFGPWLRANGQHPVSLEIIIAELQRLNANSPTPLTYQSPKTLSSHGLNGKDGRYLSPVPFNITEGTPTTRQTSKANTINNISTPPGFLKPQWNILFPKVEKDKTSTKKPDIKENTKEEDVSKKNQEHQAKGHEDWSKANELFDLSFLPQTGYE